MLLNIMIMTAQGQPAAAALPRILCPLMPPRDAPRDAFRDSQGVCYGHRRFRANVKKVELAIGLKARSLP